MKSADFLSIALPMLIGGTLVARSVRKALEQRLPQKFPEAYRRRHSRLVEWLEGKKILRIPGLGLANPIPPFIYGELAGSAILALACCTGRTTDGLIPLAPFALTAGSCVAWAALASASRKALYSVQRDLPMACFLLSLLLESGMGASSALQETARSMPRGALSMELEDMAAARSMGVSKGESIRRSGERVPLEEYRLFLNHILQGERLGIGLSKSLRGISARMLENRDHRAETIAQQAAVKLLFPLVCFIFPAVFLIILSPVIFSLWDRFPG